MYEYAEPRTVIQFSVVVVGYDDFLNINSIYFTYIIQREKLNWTLARTTTNVQAKFCGFCCSEAHHKIYYSGKIVVRSESYS